MQKSNVNGALRLLTNNMSMEVKHRNTVNKNSA